MNGILNVYKEKGYTSHDVVAKLRGILKQRKIGHTGTLDPDAEGVLPVCLGHATKLCDTMVDYSKTYEAVILFGVITDTLDYTGTVLQKQASLVTKERLVSVLEAFVGIQKQIPPMYSAIKVNGKKLYELARNGIEIERKSREIEITSLDLLEITADENGYLLEAKIRVSCSKGTYIRTLCHDIGTKLICGACMKALERTRVGDFFSTEGLRLLEIERLVAANTLEEHLITPEKYLERYPAVFVRPQADKLLYNGNQLFKEHFAWEKEYDFIEDQSKFRIYDSQGVFLGLYSYREKKNFFQPEKLFFLGRSENSSQEKAFGKLQRHVEADVMQSITHASQQVCLGILEKEGEKWST